MCGSVNVRAQISRSDYRNHSQISATMFQPTQRMRLVNAVNTPAVRRVWRLRHQLSSRRHMGATEPVLTVPEVCPSRHALRAKSPPPKADMRAERSGPGYLLALGQKVGETRLGSGADHVGRVGLRKNS